MRQGVRMKRRLWVNLGLVLAIVLVLVGIFSSMRGSQEPPAQRTVTVATSDVAATASATGEVVAPEAVTMAFATPGIVESVRVRAGDTVRAGEVLATVDAVAARQQLASAESALAQARSAAANAGDQLAITEQSVKASEASLDEAVTQAKANLATARATWSEACLNPDDPTCPNPAAAESIRQAQNSITVAQLAYDTAATNAARNETTYNLSVNQALVSLDAARSTASWQCSTYGDTSANCRSAQDALLPKQQAYDSAVQTRTDRMRTDGQAVESASMTLSNANVAMRKLQADLRKAHADGVRQAEQALTNAKSARAKGKAANAQQLQTAQSGLQAVDGSPSPNQAAVTAAQAGVAAAQQAVKRTTLRAPVAGTVGAVNLTEGESSAGSAAAAGGITIVPTSAFEVEAGFAESDAAHIEPGQAATITFDGLPNVTAGGTVAAVDPVASTSASGLVTFTVRIGLDQVPEGLRNGMTATVSVVTETATQVLAVPQAAITAVGGRTTVEVLQADGTTQRVDVTTGIQGDTLTEITSGVREGQQLVIPTAETSGFPAGGVPGQGAGGAGGGRGPFGEGGD